MFLWYYISTLTYFYSSERLSNMKPHGLKIVLEQGRILALRSAKSKVCARTGSYTCL